MIDLDFLITPKVVIDGISLVVEITGSSPVWPDHNDYLHLRLMRGREVLKDEPRVLKSEVAVDAWLNAAMREAVIVVKRDRVRSRKFLGR